MRFICALLMGAIFIEITFAQSSGIVTQATSTQDAADIRQEQQLQLESLIANAESEANRQKLDLQNQYAALQVQRSKCGTDKSIANIQAQKDADDKKTNAQTSALQQGIGGVAPLLGGFKNMFQAGNAKANEEIKNAVDTYNQSNSPSDFSHSSNSNSSNTSSKPASSSQGTTAFNPAFVTCTTTRMSSDGKNVANVLRDINVKMAQNVPGTPTFNQGCYAKLAHLKGLAEEARDTIQKAEKEKAQMGEGLTQTAAAAAQLGLSGYMMNQGKKGAENDLKAANQIGDISYQACVEGIESQAEAIQRQIDAINAQLASDIDRLRKQFAAKRVDIAPNDSKGLPVAEDTNIGVSELSGGGVPGSKFSSKNPLAGFNNKKNLGGFGGGSNSGGAGSGGGLAGSNDGVGWDFKNPNDNTDPDKMNGLTKQPDSGTLASGGDGGGGGVPSGENPFGDPLMPGAEDPFANVGPEGAKQLTSYGNGFMELARLTHRRVYAHLNELLGGSGTSSGPQISNKENKNPERTITSTKN